MRATKRSRSVPTDDRFTGPEIFELVRRVWPGGADTDPAWHPRSFSRARTCYPKCCDGLRRTWLGRVWLNPPWSSPGPWVARLLEQLRRGTASEAMLLVCNDPSTAWFKQAAQHASAVALLGRERYWQWIPRRRRLERGGTPGFTSAIFYFGPEADAFVAEFRAAGYVAMPLRERSNDGTVPPVARKKPRDPDIAQALSARLNAQVRDVLAAHGRENPDVTLGELAHAMGDGLPILLTLRVRDLWPQPDAPAPAPVPKNGNGKRPPRAAVKASVKAEKPKPDPVRKPPRADALPAKLRVEQVRDVIAKLRVQGRTEFVAADIMDALGCSRQTALRTLQRIPEVKRTGKLKSAKYQVKPS